MRLTVCLESDTEGQGLASVDIEDVLKQCKENLISKEAFEKMKSRSHNYGHRQGYAKAIDDFLSEICKMYVQSERNGNYRFYTVEIKQSIADLAKQLKEKYNEQRSVGNDRE